ncbi:hypothetical protein NWF32_27600 [Pseudomonas qingdaonensis]|nr:hypothetical protein [Pseudomonas qingdaonensis]
MDDLLALGKAESADLAHRAGTVRHTMVSLFSALVGGAPPCTDPAPASLY